jgi:type II secretory ATPase GspE/PulE/Tfp pilus assembly ATPase PilB-like protein
MSDFPSLQSNGLSKQDDKYTPGVLNISSTDIDKKFQKKMQSLRGLEKEREVYRTASSGSIQYIDLEKFPISQESLRQLTKNEAEKNNAVVFFFTQDEFRLAAIKPDSPQITELLHQISERTHANGELYAISERSFARVLKMYDRLPVIASITKDISIHPEDLDKVKTDVDDFSSLQRILQKATTTDVLTYVLGAAFKLNASDVHIEAEEHNIAVRLRLDGILHDAATLKKESYKKIISRIKLVSSLKINITEKPQDGRFTIKLSEGDVDVRVSTIPTVYGESIVMRLLRQNRGGLTLDKLGLIGSSYDKLLHEIDRPNGMIITTGPTGSGKTTTLYACMQLLNKPGVKIITLEDPVEYKMEGINQSHIDRTKGYTFAGGLKSMLRQDPNIAMVGEIRDLETADIAIQAALTGHLILSTIHTNSAAGAIPRFLSMGVKPFLLAPSLNSVIGQRLVRRLCDKCKIKAELSEEHLNRVKKSMETLPEKEKKELGEKLLEFFAPKGCDACGGIGYKGQVGIYEILIMSPEIEAMILGGNVSEFEIEKKSVEDGMVLMVQDGLLKALDGKTSVEEVFRVIE